VALVFACAIDLVKGIVLFSAGTWHFPAAFVSPLLQTFTFVSIIQVYSVLIYGIIGLLVSVRIAVVTKRYLLLFIGIT